MKNTLPGEIWRVDFGMAAEVSPALILSDYPGDDELALLVVIPHTTAVRSNRWELQISKPFLKPGVFHPATNSAYFAFALRRTAWSVDTTGAQERKRSAHSIAKAC